MKWTKEHIEKLNLKTNLSDLKTPDGTRTPIDNKSPAKELKSVLNGKISIEKEYIKAILWMFKRDGLIPGYVEELQFHDVRMFRFDWAITQMRIGIEYEGVISRKSRHTTLKGYSEDTRKYNLATIDGWTVLRYTALTYKEISNDLRLLIKTKNK